jgi:glycosyltransferase involved in cell wall biosynthesis
LKISIITPSYNQGWALERTIKSVLQQECKDIEYIIIDGGSSDDSVSIIKKYERQLAYWISEPDRGQSHAINKGFAKATGDILCWLNSDDFLAPHAINKVLKEFERRPDIDVLTGGWISYYQDSKSYVLARSCGMGLSPGKMLLFGSGALLGQHSTFWKHELWRKTGGLNERYHYAMDHDLFCRFSLQGARFKAIDDYLAFFTLYQGQKSADIVKYADESRRAKAHALGTHFFYNTRFNYRIVALLRSIFKHRNIHPSIGLKAPEPDFEVKAWVQEISLK